jgi:DNA-binding MarR family transcriptional regulator
MSDDEAVLRIQLAYPKIYLACHKQHQNARTTPHGLSPRDSSLLAHLDPVHPVEQAELGRHLGLAKSTLSEAMAWLVECGFALRAKAENGRGQAFLLSAKGVEAVSESSVLESSALARLVAALGDARDAAIAGLERIAATAAALEDEREPRSTESEPRNAETEPRGAKPERQSAALQARSADPV